MLLQDNWKEVTGVLAMIGVFFLCMLYLGLQSKFGAVRDEGDDPFQNGLDLAFLARVLFQGLSIDSFIRNMCRRTRGRIFVGFKRYLFFGRTYVFLGHPSLVKQVFGPHRSKLYQKVTGQIGNDSGRRNMLFAGDGPGWSNVKRELCPYFFRADFAVEDDIMNRIVQKHLQRVSNYHHGETELLELCLLIVVDLLSNVLFKYEIPIEELQMLTLALTKYVAPGGSANKRTFPEGLTALQYQDYIVNKMLAAAPEGSVGHMLRHCPTLDSEEQSHNATFFMQAITPAFAAFWTVCNINMMSRKEDRNRARVDATFRDMCVKESLRMYPPVSMLWSREATKDHELKNPLYRSTSSTTKPSFLKKLLLGTGPIEEQPTIKIKKGTYMIAIPFVLHSDDRFWVNAGQFDPERWRQQPTLIDEDGGLKVERRQDHNQEYPGLVRRKSMARKFRRSSLINPQVLCSLKMEAGLRAQVFGVEHEQAAAHKDHLREAMGEATDLDQSWTFFPFGLGPHQCMGRRLAVRMVDVMVHGMLDYNATFYSGVIPSLFSRKQLNDRMISLEAVYNFPADPVYVQLEEPHKRGTFQSRKSAIIIDAFDKLGSSKVFGRDFVFSCVIEDKEGEELEKSKKISLGKAA